MRERKNSRQLAKMMDGQSIEDQQLESLKNTADTILKIASQENPSEATHDIQRAKLLAAIVE